MNKASKTRRARLDAVKKVLMLLVLNGPNLNNLGKRDKAHYGALTLSALERMMRKHAKPLGVRLLFFQSNHEGSLIDFIQKRRVGSDALIINPGALTHYGYSLYDAIIDSKLPSVEVHLSDISKREPFRRRSVIKAACVKQIMGKKEQGYIEALEFLVRFLENKKEKEVV
ncbi:MAG: 3-dehydroquinate dehydratase [Parcubacteria group bacterium GW2011_GWA2_44_12]|nr:MAG: 3-dehydroquinate dehydratase [Parcubacteria group bacterium GW2011_GWA2_44_12]